MLKKIMLDANNLISLPEKYTRLIHSIVLIGSYAVETEEKGSDIDIVLICKKAGYRETSDYLYERKLENFKDSDSSARKIQYVCFDESKIQHIFKMGSPIAFAIRKGRVLKDDGFLKNFLEGNDPETPTREYYLFALESLAWRYYYTLKSFETETRKDHASDGFCTKSGKCIGHSPADILATVIMRMLYIILPARGYMPFSKRDVQEFAEKVYGRHITEMLNKIFYIHRHEVFDITLDEYRVLKPFAVQLFREVLMVAGIREDTLKILKSAAMVCRR